MSAFHDNVLIGSSAPTGYNLSNSLRFRSSASAYLNRTPASAGNRKTWTWSGWVKGGVFASPNAEIFSCNLSGSNEFTMEFDGVNRLRVYDYTSSYQLNLETSSVYRDPSAWYHIVLAFDTTQATAANRAKLYVNGQQITAFATATYPSQNYDGFVNSASQHNIGRTSYGYFNGYMTEVNFIDGQALTPSSFGETSTTTGVWIPKKYAGTYGTNGFYLPFTDNSALTTSSNVGLGRDYSGNGNYWTTNNISITAGETYDSMTDVPTLTSTTAANYCVLNPLNVDPVAPIFALSDGNLRANNSTVQGIAFGTIGITSGKFYFEYVITTLPSNPTSFVGFASSPYSGATARNYRYDTGQYFNGTAWVTYGATWGANDVIGVAIDMTGQTIEFFKNGTSQGQQTSIGLTGNTVFPVIYMNASNGTGNVNFGQRPFAYTPPTGFNRLNTFNLPTPTIGASASTLANKNFDATTYTGTGATLAVTNSGAMQPDWVWLKIRSGASSHVLIDSVRGYDKYLASNSTASESTSTDQFLSFNSNGFTLGANSGAGGNTNQSGSTYVGWQWRANGAAVTNTAGSISSQVSANTSAGFSVVTFTNTAGRTNFTVGHGLGVAPKMVIMKTRSVTADWVVYHESMGANKAMYLNQSSAEITSSNFFNNTAPTSSVVTFGSGTSDSGVTIVAYCFSQVAGYSAFGSYTGNGSADGTFVFTGFRPKFVMVKRTDSAGFNWVIVDTARDPINVTGNLLLPNTSGAEASAPPLFDYLSNGFKLRDSGTGLNGSGGTYIYMAFAESPFKYANAR